MRLSIIRTLAACVANGTVQFPVCANKSSAAGIHFAAGYIFMRVLTHIADQARGCQVIYTKGAPRLGHWLRERSSSLGATCPVAIGGFV
jgi:hypothetical protein